MATIKQEEVSGKPNQNGQGFGFSDVLAVAHWTGVDQKILDLLKSWGIDAQLPATMSDLATNLKKTNSETAHTLAKILEVEAENLKVKEKAQATKMELQSCLARLTKLEEESQKQKEELDAYKLKMEHRWQQQQALSIQVNQQQARLNQQEIQLTQQQTLLTQLSQKQKSSGFLCFTANASD